MSVCERQEAYCFQASALIFAHFQRTGDYESARKYLLKQIDYASDTFLFGMYGLAKGFLRQSDFEKTAPKLLEQLRLVNTEEYLDALIKRDEFETALNAMKEATEPNYRWYGVKNYYDAARRLEAHFPEAVIEYYLGFVFYLIAQGAGKGRRNYKQAVVYLKYAKSVYLNALKDKPRWQSKLAEIREMFSARRAFLEEARKVD
jgi:hypothetical protein